MNKSMLFVLIFCLAVFVFSEYKKYRKLDDGLLHIYFFNIGHGDSALIKTPDMKILMVDAGPDESVSFEISRVLPFWINELDYIVLSHWHRDHYMGFYYLGKFFKFKETLYLNPLSLNYELKNIINSMLAREKKSMKSFVYSAKYEFKDCDFLQLVNYPFLGSENPIDRNNQTILSYLSYCDFDLFFSADASIDLQLEMLKYLPYKSVEVLKVPHQGSRFDLCFRCLSFLGAKDAVLSVGENNYGHPHREVLGYYESLGINLYRTDISTNFILIKTNGFEYSIVYN